MSELPNTVALHSKFATSNYGRELRQNARFGDFKPDWVNTELWTELIGPDVNNLYHMPHTLDLATEFCTAAQLDADTSRILRTTAITHDWGEALIGDIPLPNKTAADEKKEKIAYGQIAYELFPKHADELTATVWSVLDHEDERRGDLFRAIEYVGYCTSAMRAGNAALRLSHGFTPLAADRKRKEQLIGGLLGMENAVRIRNFPILTKYVQVYPALEKLIR